MICASRKRLQGIRYREKAALGRRLKRRTERGGFRWRRLLPMLQEVDDLLLGHNRRRAFLSKSRRKQRRDADTGCEDCQTAHLRPQARSTDKISLTTSYYSIVMQSAASVLDAKDARHWFRPARTLSLLFRVELTEIAMDCTHPLQENSGHIFKLGSNSLLAKIRQRNHRAISACVAPAAGAAPLHPGMPAHRVHPCCEFEISSS